MKKLLFLLNAIVFISTYSINYYNYNIPGSQPYTTTQNLILDTLSDPTYNGYSFNLNTAGSDFEIRFQPNVTIDYTNNQQHAFRNMKFEGVDPNNKNIVTLKGQTVGKNSTFYTQRVDLENVILEPSQLNLIMKGDDGTSQINMKNSEINLLTGKLMLNAGETFTLNSLIGSNKINKWNYNSTGNVNINIDSNSELIFSYAFLNLDGKTKININNGKFTIEGDSSKFHMRDNSSKFNLLNSELVVKNSNADVILKNMTSENSNIEINGDSAKLVLEGSSIFNNTNVNIHRGYLEVNALEVNGINTINLKDKTTMHLENTNINGELIIDNNEKSSAVSNIKFVGVDINGKLTIDNSGNGNVEFIGLNVNGGHLVYNGNFDSSKNKFGTATVNTGVLEFNENSALSGNLILNDGNIMFNSNKLYGSLNGNGGFISGSVDVIGGGSFGADLSGSTYQTTLKSNEVEDLANNRYKADMIYSNSFINNMNTIVVEGDSINAKDYENKKFTVANAPTITGSKNIIHGATLPALVEFDVIDESSVSDQDVTLVGKLKPTSSLANHSSITTNNSGGSQSNAQQVVNILPPTTTGGNQPPLSSGAQKLQNALFTMTNAQVSQNLNSLHAEPYSSHLTVGLEQNDLFLNMIMDRSLPKGKAYTGHIEEVNLENNMWFDIGYKEGKVSSEDELGNFKYSLTNVILGGDLYKEDQLILGAYGGYGKHKMREHDMVTQDFETDSYHLGGYGSYIYKDLIFTGVFGYAYGNNQSERDVVVGTESGTSKDRFDSHSIYTGIRGAYPIEIAPKIILTPNAGLSYSYLYQEDVVESGFDMADLKVDSTSADSFISSVGLNLTYDGVISSTPVRPMTFVRYEHDWSAAKDSTHDVRAGFVHTPDSMTTFTGQNRGKNLVLVGIGVEVEVTPTFLVGVELSYSDDTNGEETGVGFNLEYLW